MNFVKFFLNFSYCQLKNFAKLTLMRPVTSLSGTLSLDRDDVKLAREWLKRRSEWYRTDLINEYHDKFAYWNGSAFAYSFMGGRVALSAIIYALDLREGDEVIIPGYTCIVVPNAFHYAGIKTVYSDIELDTYGLDAKRIEDKITSKTKAILLHHLYGLVSRDYEKILEIGKARGLKIIEDCAHSTGAVYKGKKVGNYGDASFYSSERSKIFNTIQGGIAVTNNKEIAVRLKEYYDRALFPDDIWIDKLLNNVILYYYQFKHSMRWLLGDIFNYAYRKKELISTNKDEERGIRPAHYGRKMPAPVAALGLNQLKKIDFLNEQRRLTAIKWDQWCDDNAYQKPLVIDNSVPVYLRYPVLVTLEKKLNRKWAFKELGVEAGVWFVSNCDPADLVVEGCPIANQAVKQCINLPC